MSDRHFAHWPSNLPRHLTIPATNLYRNVEFSAARYPDKAALVFYDGITTYREFDEQIQRLGKKILGCIVFE